MGRETERPARSNDPGSRVVQPHQVYDDTLPAADLCLVSCVKTKLRERAPGKELYVSDWFCKARAVIEAAGWPWYILSAKYGLVDPDAVIEPYEKTLNAKSEQIEWSRKVMGALDSRLVDVDSVVIFAGEKYRKFLEPALRKRGIAVHVPMKGLKSGEQLARLIEWMDRSVNVPRAPEERIADTVRFYELLACLERRMGGVRTLAACDGHMDWPRRGVYFFFEEEEERSVSGSGPRVVRIGTHALTAASRTSLWNRLSQHRGSARIGAGNHRGSIFRLIIGAALARRGDCPLPPTWGIGSDPGAAARKLDMDRASVRSGEADLERRVSAYIGRMPFLWLNVDDGPGPDSQRGLIERHAIALLSHARTPAADVPSSRWLGAFSDWERVRTSGLWNNNHVEENYDASFLDMMERLVGT